MNKKILIIGSPGAGKSVLAKRLHDKLGIELIHLDQYYWKPNWIKPESDQWERTIQDLLKKVSFIMDGNYRSTLHLRLPIANTIIFLDPSRFTCFYRIIKRRLTKNREDDISGCEERISWDLVRWVLWRYPQVARKDILQKLKNLKTSNPDKTVVILQAKKEVDVFLQSFFKIQEMNQYYELRRNNN
ncbi:MAG: AAA family ATPase [Candidatus Ryanbacteria bacterium CG10_big_fil_rev_8_21_14_0_10_43_42]|uniref:AAA family ATPase n=1 Tax=Candidatus Ryanbacteria bacterium CG10_big_fil_rev_8_21_14_0_10_43_42 TaxID=1974864 RepID=A0A2M8KYE9_9BACT|nr:MAG: AAA family ATPase [Candidatus Ryanbacteria bacterium CG10_big_fil_rev_8_21_14_0_10_43_42]